MKFVADVMLGRLARLMRFTGYDVEYDSRAEDDWLLHRSRWRVLLSRDHELIRSARADRAYFVITTGAENQFREIQARFPLEPSAAARCMLCNVAIRPIRKEKVQHLVPPYVYRVVTEFFRCASCRRIYWKGTHFDQMFRMIK